MSSIAHPNLTVVFDPGLPEQFSSLRAYIAFRVQEQRLNAASLAGKMDLSPSTLSRKLNQNEGDTQRFNCDDLEAYIKETKDIGSVMAYLASKFVETPEARKDRALTRVEAASAAFEAAVAAFRAAQ
ncbi:hypothetical protein [Variovorax boronicumulans]